jgi:hypothetical protein
MRRSILLALMLAVPAVSCSKKSDKKDEAAAETPPADKGTPGEVADETPPEPNPDKPSSPPTTPPVAVDCEKLLTADDVAKACGGKAGDIEVKKHAMENGTGATACVRNAGFKAKRTSSIHLAVSTAPGTPDAARALLDLSKEGAKPVEGLGEGAYLHVREEAAAKQTAHHLEAVKGALWFKLGYEVVKGDKKPICSDEGLVELGKAVAGRLP